MAGMRKFKDFVIGAAGRANMSRGVKQYWAEVRDGEKSRAKHYHITAHDVQIDSENGHKADGVHFRITKRAS